MKFAQTLLTLAPALAATALTACGGGNNAPATPAANAPPPTSPGTLPGTPGAPAPTPGTQSLDTAAVLAQARQASETASPYSVNTGALTLTDTSETTQSINVN